MAAGTSFPGASIELSADAPLREPYIGYLQGGLSYAHVKFALMEAVKTCLRKA
jgi:cystathionine beta-lyase family protein involved in aluminum resistance